MGEPQVTPATDRLGAGEARLTAPHVLLPDSWRGFSWTDCILKGLTRSYSCSPSALRPALPLRPASDPGRGGSGSGCAGLGRAGFPLLSPLFPGTATATQLVGRGTHSAVAPLVTAGPSGSVRVLPGTSVVRAHSQPPPWLVPAAVEADPLSATFVPFKREGGWPIASQQRPFPPTPSLRLCSLT